MAKDKEAPVVPERATQATTRPTKVPLRDCEAAMVTRESTFTLVKVKCLNCSLHFLLCTWFPERHNPNSLHCPECGQQTGRFLIWAEPGPGFIFEHVPGKALLVEVGRQADNCEESDSE